jgi:hypothetical protein
MQALDNLSSYLVGHQQLPTLHYIPDIISEADEQRLLQEVHASKAKWVQVSRMHVLAYYCCSYLTIIITRWASKRHSHSMICMMTKTFEA